MAYKADDFIQAITGTGGIISSIAAKVNCDWYTVKRAIDRYSTVKDAYDAECERVADRAEQILIDSINKGDTGDAKWYLSRIRRGKYATRSETDITTGGEKIQITWGDDD